ncbi:galactose-3-O-sulfotransferase 2-like [Argopecten irradians]|uniref:galactose-3-O-sulfotransferase 2-like n=1 Tax=Argopecten irradians TaxID=31199 RepID=UPI00371009EE
MYITRTMKKLRSYYVVVVLVLYIIWLSYVMYTGPHRHDKVSTQQTFVRGKKDVEKRHIAFLKVHKAASTTVQNVFLRFAMRRDLLVVLPKVPKFFFPNIISLRNTITSRNILPAPRNRSYDITCCHVIYNRTAFDRIMPRDTVYIGIVRDPFDHFKSILNYFRPKQVFDIDDPFPVSRFLENPHFYNNGSSISFLDNSMAMEYNFPPHVFRTRNKTEIQRYIHKLDSEFDLIMVVEHFDESLILLRRLLNWEIKDVIYIKKNVKRHGAVDFLFNPGDGYRHQIWDEIDYALYDHFYNKLQALLRAQGPDIHEEVNYFRRLRRDIEFFCQQYEDDFDTYKVVKSRWTAAFDVTEWDCHYMNIPEIPFIKELRLKQYGYYQDNLLKKDAH